MTPAQRLRRLHLDAEEPSGGAATGPWLVTFTDLVSLILGVFVLIYAMQDPRPIVPRAPGHEALPPAIEAPLAPSYLEQVFQRHLAREPALAETRLSLQGERLVLHLPTDLLFADGSAGLEPEGQALLQALAPLLAPLSQGVEVLGYSDPRPYAGTRFLNNRDLSLARALAVAAALQGAGRTRAVSAQGYGSDRLDEAARLAGLDAAAAADPSQLTPDARESLYRLARRVDIAILAAVPPESLP